MNLCFSYQKKMTENIHTYNLDGREFIKKAVRDLTQAHFDHFIMNLPATAIEFLGKNIARS